MNLGLPHLKRLLVAAGLVGLCAATVLGVTLAQSFAALSVTPRGSQNFDLSTNITTLAEGGLVVDKETGLELEADFIRYEEGGFIEAQAAAVLGEFGSLESDKLYVDSLEDVILAEGGVTLLYNELSLTADALTVYLEPDVVILQGNVKSDLPSFESEGLAIYLASEQALLLSPYSYTSGPLRLRQPSAGKQLQLNPRDAAQGAMSYDASSSVTPELLSQLEPYLGQP